MKLLPWIFLCATSIQSCKVVFRVLWLRIVSRVRSHIPMNPNLQLCIYQMNLPYSRLDLAQSTKSERCFRILTKLGRISSWQAELLELRIFPLARFPAVKAKWPSSSNLPAQIFHWTGRSNEACNTRPAAMINVERSASIEISAGCQVKAVLPEWRVVCSWAE